MDEFILRLVELPSTVNAVTVLDDNGDFNVYVNSRLSDEEQKKADYDNAVYRENKKSNSIQFWTLIVSILALLASIASIAVPFIVS